MTNKACQVNFDEMNIETSYRSGAWLYKIKKWPEIEFLREQINETIFITRSLFSLKISNREEGNNNNNNINN